MANNPFLVKSGQIQVPPPVVPNPSVPQIIILDPFAQSVTEYALNYNDLTALETVYIVANTTSVGMGSVTIYMPSLPVVSDGKKITIMSMSVDDVIITPGSGAFINWDNGYINTLKPGNGVAAPALNAITFIADTQVTPSWYTIYSFATLF